MVEIDGGEDGRTIRSGCYIQNATGHGMLLSVRKATDRQYTGKNARCPVVESPRGENWVSVVSGRAWHPGDMSCEGV